MMTANMLVIFFCIKGLTLMLGCAQDFSRDKENKRAYNEKRRENKKIREFSVEKKQMIARKMRAFSICQKFRDRMPTTYECRCSFKNVILKAIGSLFIRKLIFNKGECEYGRLYYVDRPRDNKYSCDHF